MKLVNTGHIVSLGRRPQSRILRCLHLLIARVNCIGAPDWCCIACDRFSQCVVGQQKSLLLLFPGRSRQRFYILSILSILSVTWFQCLWKDKDGPIITPSIFGLRSSGSCISSRVISGCGWNWCVSGVKGVTVDFGAEIKSEFPSGRYLHRSGNC